ncbi:MULTISPECIES: hypothetical protein [Mesorhizobium]|nr:MULTISPECIES: hypothetical protein [Mesorhizobium]
MADPHDVFLCERLKGGIADCTNASIVAGMGAQYVDLVLLEQSLADTGGLNRPFSDRVGDIAQKTAGSVLFDVRVDGDPGIQRIAAIGYGAEGVVAVVMDRDGGLASAPVDGGSYALIAELSAWCALPMAEQISASYLEAATKLLAELAKAGRIDRDGPASVGGSETS